MFRLLRRMRRSDDGQSIVLAAVSMLILALGVLMTINLGHAVQQKIQLQNAADASAYSLAAMEARAFNFFAFSNRAQVAHYNAMMVQNAYIAWLTRMEAFVGVLRDNSYYIHTIGCLACKAGCYPPAVVVGCWGCPLEQAFKPIGDAFDAVVQPMTAVLDAVDQPTAMMVNLLSKGNYYGVYTMQYIVGAALETHLMDSMRTVTQRNVADVDFAFTDAMTMAANLAEFEAAFDPVVGPPHKKFASSWKNASDEATRKAKRVMAEVVNATRTPTNHLTNQTLPVDVPGLDQVMGLFFGGQTKLIDQDHFDPSQDLSGEYNGPGPGWGVKDTRRENDDESKLNPGDVLASDSWFKLGMVASGVPGGSLLGSVYSLYVVASPQSNQRRHLRWERHNFSYCSYFYGMIEIFGFNAAISPFPQINSSDDHHDHHEWEGVNPFMKFAPSSEPSADFNQPSTYVLLNKKPEDLERVFTKQFDYQTGAGDRQEIDFHVGTSGMAGTGILTGLNAVSRGLVYYHRPGNWQEHPNFFNPFWRAKLAPLAQDPELDQRLPVLAPWVAMPTGPWIMH